MPSGLRPLASRNRGLRVVMLTGVAHIVSSTSKRSAMPRGFSKWNGWTTLGYSNVVDAGAAPQTSLCRSDACGDVHYDRRQAAACAGEVFSDSEFQNRDFFISMVDARKPPLVVLAGAAAKQMYFRHGASCWHCVLYSLHVGRNVLARFDVRCWH